MELGKSIAGSIWGSVISPIDKSLRASANDLITEFGTYSTIWVVISNSVYQSVKNSIKNSVYQSVFDSVWGLTHLK